MNKKHILIFFLAGIAIFSYSFRNTATQPEAYAKHYLQRLQTFKQREQHLLAVIDNSDLTKHADVERIKQEIANTRLSMKSMDYWLRYLEPLAYKKINSPLPVEWETEVFEKFEKPYKREGAGLTLAELYLDEEHITKDSLKSLITQSITVFETYGADSITSQLNTYHHFYLCNRLFLLNLAAIYTTGFECPNTDRVIPELKQMLADVGNTYHTFNESFPAAPLTAEYTQLYAKTVAFIETQPEDYTKFDHFTFLKEYVNRLFTINQQLIRDYKVISKNLLDYSLNKSAATIFSKTLYNGQNPKGIFLRVNDEEGLAEIDRIGKLLFYDPILSANNMRSCASCHNPATYFTDTVLTTSQHFDHTNFLPRNAPSLINVEYNHLTMLDGKHISLQNQTKDVICNPNEMGSDEKEVLEKVMSCKEYSSAFNKLLKYTPQEKEVTMDHIASVITFYYSKFSKYYSPFDAAMNNHGTVDVATKEGFNLFMSKAQCATCHFVPQFNGVKPPYIGSEFEVLGVPADKNFKALSKDKGRYEINPAYETANAFRTGSIRNADYTKPYMHNGVFNTMGEVIDFYNAGGGAGRGLHVENQTLSSDSLKLTVQDKNHLLKFISSLNENIAFESAPEKLPSSKIKTLNNRRVGGSY